MERTQALWAVIVGIPSVVLGLLPLLYPALTPWLVGALVVLWVSSVVAWLLQRLALLQSQINTLMQKGADQLGGWKALEEVELFLDGWQATQRFSLIPGDILKVGVSGPKRFTVCLSNTVSKKRFEIVEKSPETKNWKGTWQIFEPGNYWIVVQPSGESPFWVQVKVELKPKAEE